MSCGETKIHRNGSWGPVGRDCGGGSKGKRPADAGLFEEGFEIGKDFVGGPFVAGIEADDLSVGADEGG